MSPWRPGGGSSFQSPRGSLWVWRMPNGVRLTNLGPSWGGAQPQSGPPPRAFGNCPVLGGRQSREEDGSGLRSFLGVPKSPVRVLTLAFSEAPTSVPDHRGLRVGRGRLFRSPSQQFRSGRWLWVAAFLGSLSLAPGEPEHAPGSAPGRGAGGRRALGYPGSVRTSPQVLGPDPAPRCAAGTPALCAPAPAAQLLRMTSSHLPPPGPHLPEGWGVEGGGRCVRKFPGPLGNVVPARLKGSCQTRGNPCRSLGSKLKQNGMGSNWG